MLYYFAKFFAVLYLRILYGFKIYNRENIPKQGRLILCANHSHNIDAILVAATTTRKVTFLAKRELFKSWIFNPIMKIAGAIPVNRDGNDLASIKASLKVLKGEQVLGIFPEGERRKGHENLEFKPGVSMLAIKTSSPLVPIYIQSEYKWFHKIRVYVGEPILLSQTKEALTTDDYTRIANTQIAERILNLKKIV
jgi:1-acyl-sn-glycerol-3-phosphate acyltransferase